MLGIGRRVNALAPIRICDIGGWTDTWFAGHGAVLNVAVQPAVEVQVITKERTTANRVEITLENYGYSYRVDPDSVSFDKHPLIEAAISSMPLPEEMAFEINVYSSVPPGASTGTSAAVSVALIGALDALSPGRATPHEAAMIAHRLETDKLGLQSGIQDQLCSAYGGINFIQMNRYPDASVCGLRVADEVWWEFETRLVLVYIGSPHSSSEVHKRVIAGLGECPGADSRLEELRVLASAAKDALYVADFPSLGSIMDQNTDVQRRLHKDLVCARFEDVIDIASAFRVIGAKVNGAGGDGGSMTLLTDGDKVRKRALVDALRQKGYQPIAVQLSRTGLSVWQA